jgi:adenylate kinase
MRILLSGPPSSGKSTQGRRLAAALGLPHVSSGDLIREAARSGDPRDVELLRLVSDGSLAPSGAIANMVHRRLSRDDCEAGFVLDGFPRKPMEAAFAAMTFRIDALLVLETDRGTLLSRMRSRAAAGRADDDPAHFPRRIAAYESDTRSAQRELVRAGIPLIPISAAGCADETEALIAEAVATFADRRDVRFA